MLELFWVLWDDDVDISMTRHDYNKMLDIFRKNAKISDDLFAVSPEFCESSFPICKIYSKRFRVKEKDLIVPEGEYLWIDIFPFDGISNDKNENQKLYKKVRWYRRLHAIKKQSFKKYINDEPNYFLKFVKVFVKPIVNIRSSYYYSKKIANLGNCYNYDDAELVQEYIWTTTNYDVIYSKEHFDETIDIQFENYKFKTFAEYDVHLRNLYGDYMKLPPSSERDTHLDSFWKV